MNGNSPNESAANEVERELEALEPITKTIADPALRGDIVGLLAAEILARLSLQQIALTPYEEPEYDVVDLAMWESLAQPVRSALMALHELRTRVVQFAPVEESAQEDVDLAFDLVESASPEVPLRDSLGQQVDDWLKHTLDVNEEKREKSRSPEEQRKDVQEAIAPLASILVDETRRFALRLRNPTIVAQRWALLADLQELRGKFSKLLGALRIGLLSPFTDLDEEALLHDYRTEAQSSVSLRVAVVELTADVARLIAAYHSGHGDDRRFALEELLVRLMRFAATDAFVQVRAPDKRAVIEFRKSLAMQLGHDAQDRRAVAQLLEGFAKFLEAMHAINQREVLVKHDRAAMATLRTRVLTVEAVMPLDFESALKVFKEARADAQALFGREPLLDLWLKAEELMSTREDVALHVQWVKRSIERSGLA
jgi:hypothetical protein